MITSQYKERLLQLKDYYALTSEFFPNQFYSIRKFDINLTNENNLMKMPNLNRNLEKTYVYVNSVHIDTNEFFFYFKKNNFKKCLEMINFYIENILNIIDNKRKYSNINDVLERIKIMFYDGFINYSFYYNSLKIVEKINEYIKDKFYIKNVNKTGTNFFKTSEINYTYKNSDKNNYNINKEEIVKIIQYFKELLQIYNQVEYQKVIEEFQIKLNILNN